MAGEASSSSATLANLGSAFGSSAGGLESLANFGTSLFGTSSTQNQNSTTKGTVKEKLNIDKAGVQKILQDILGGEQGLASIFSAEQVSGIYNSSVAAQASGDLLTKLAGEIAKLTAEKTQTTDSTTTAKTKGGTGGLLKQIF